jgi:hypothetical protein
MSDLYRVYSEHPPYKLDRTVKEKDLAKAISDYKKLHPTRDVFFHKVKEG